jgi:UDP-3-O-[3-hydroxymyristoyl] glucosamine N-acyltransferase
LCTPFTALPLGSAFDLNDGSHSSAAADEHATLGPGCIIGKGVYIGAGVSLGANCKVQNYSCVYEGATLEDGGKAMRQCRCTVR